MIQYKASNTKLTAKMIMIINKYISKTANKITKTKEE